MGPHRIQFLAVVEPPSDFSVDFQFTGMSWFIAYIIFLGVLLWMRQLKLLGIGLAIALVLALGNAVI